MPLALFLFGCNSRVNNCSFGLFIEIVDPGVSGLWAYHAIMCIGDTVYWHPRSYRVTLDVVLSHTYQRRSDAYVAFG